MKKKTKNEIMAFVLNVAENMSFRVVLIEEVQMINIIINVKIAAIQ